MLKHAKTTLASHQNPQKICQLGGRFPSSVTGEWHPLPRPRQPWPTDLIFTAAKFPAKTWIIMDSILIAHPLTHNHTHTHTYSD